MNTLGTNAPNMGTLTFGTDGWRDVIGERFTFANVSRAAQAYADFLHEQGTSSAVVGFDTRFNGALFARRVAVHGPPARLARGSSHFCANRRARPARVARAPHSPAPEDVVDPTTHPLPGLFYYGVGSLM